MKYSWEQLYHLFYSDEADKQTEGYNEIRRYLYSYSSSLLKSKVPHVKEIKQHALDCADEVIAVLIRQRSDIKFPVAFGGYCKTIAIRKVSGLIDDLMPLNSQPEVQLDNSSSGELLAAEFWDIIHGTDAISQSSKEILITGYLAGKSLTEIAQKEGISISEASKRRKENIGKLRSDPELKNFSV